MPDLLKTIKPSVRRLLPYTLRPDRARVKLNQNENPWDTPREIKEETLRRLTNRAWSRYPDFVPQQFHERLAEFAGWKSDGVIAGNGSNEMIQALLAVTIGRGKRILISEPTFALYRHIATVLDGEILSVPLTSNLTYDPVKLRDEIRSSDPDVTIICSPNNPTGCVIDRNELASILETTRGLVVIDEAYFEFSRRTILPFLQKYSNLVVLHTFSKAMGMAGLRIGYLLAAPQLVREIAKAVLPGNLNVISQTAAEVAIEFYELKLVPLIKLIIAERDRLFVELMRIPGLDPVPSHANFMVVRSSMEPRRVFDELLRRGILIRDVSSYPMLHDYFRVSVGTPEENDELIEALRQIFQEQI